MEFETIKKHVQSRLESELKSDLTYHDVAHTLGVLNDSIEIAKEEKVNGQDLELLKIAAMYHDTGFLFQYQGHEQASCDLAREELPEFGLAEDEIERICEMIMATKIPQNPKDIFGQILCDADLFYLGTQNYDPIAEGLYKEFQKYGIVQNEEAWIRLQIGFLESHDYFTDYAREKLTKIKESHLEKLKAIQIQD